MERNNNISFPNCYVTSLIAYGAVAAGAGWLVSKCNPRQAAILSWGLNFSCLASMERFREGRRPSFSFRLLGASLIGVGLAQVIQALQLIRIERWTGFLDNALGAFAGIGLKIPAGVIGFASLGRVLGANEEALLCLKEENIGVFLDANAQQVKDIFSRYVRSEELLPDSQIEAILFATRGRQEMPIEFIYEALKNGDRVECLRKLFQKIADAPPLPGVQEQLQQKLALFFKKTQEENVDVEMLLQERRELESQANQHAFCVRAISLWDRLTENNVLNRSNYGDLIGAQLISKAQEGHVKCKRVQEWQSTNPQIKLKEAEQMLLKRRPKVSAFSVIQDVFNTEEKLAILAKALGVEVNEIAITKKLSEGNIINAEDVIDFLEDPTDLQKVANDIALEALGDGSEAFRQICTFFKGSQVGAVEEALGLESNAEYPRWCDRLVSLNLRKQQDVQDLVGVTAKTGHALRQHYLDKIRERVQAQHKQPAQLDNSQALKNVNKHNLPLKGYHALLKTCFVGITLLVVAELVREKKRIGYFITGISLAAVGQGRLAVARRVAQEAFERRRQEAPRGEHYMPQRFQELPGLYRIGWRKLHHDTHFATSVLGTLVVIAALRKFPLLGAFLAGQLIGDEIGKEGGKAFAKRLSLEPQIHNVYSRYTQGWVEAGSNLEEDAHAFFSDPHFSNWELFVRDINNA